MTHSALVFRQAVKGDLPRIVEMLAADSLGQGRERFSNPLPETYSTAFEAITADPNNELIVACLGEEVVGVLQLTFIPYLTYQGSWRALIEGVRVAEGYRSQKVGRRLLEWAIERAKTEGCNIMQLTSDKTRGDALRFYERLGFQATHEGLKLRLEPESG